MINLENTEIHPKSTFITKSGIMILEINESENGWEYAVDRDYEYIHELFPEFNPENKNARFVIAENDEGIY